MRVKLDLRPREYIETARAQVHIGRIVGMVLLIAFFGFSSTSFLYGLILSRSLRIERLNLQADIQRMQAQRSKMNAELKRLQSQMKDYGMALITLQEELPCIEVLSVLERALPEGVWIEKADISAGKVTLSGFAFTEKDVVSFGRALSEASVVKSVGFPVTSRVNQVNGAAVKFSINCGIRDIMSISEKEVTQEAPPVKEVQ